MLELSAVAQLTPHSRNPRTITDAELGGLRASMTGYGDLSGLVWNVRNGKLVCGHQRVKAAGPDASIVHDDGVSWLVAPGGERFRIRTVDWPEPKHLGAMVAANSPHIAGDWLPELGGVLDELACSLDDFSPLRLGELRVDVPELPPVPGLTDPDAVPEPPAAAVTMAGDLWLCGAHRVLCGDSTRAEDVARVMGGERAGMMFADPPFQRDYTSRGTKGTVEKSETWPAICSAVCSLCETVTAWYVKVPWRDALDLVHPLAPDDFIVWAKRGFGLGGGDFRPQHEILLYGNHGGACAAGANVGNVWEFAVPFRGRMLHVAETPVDLICQAVRFSSKGGGIVLDPFLGSGTTMIAAEQLHRRCYGIEIEPRYCDVAVMRWQEHAGQQATLDGDGRTFAAVSGQRQPRE